MHGVGDAGRFEPDEQNIARLKGKIRIGLPCPDRKEDQAPPGVLPPTLESRLGAMPGDLHMFEIIHAGAAEMLVGDRKSGRLDDRRIEPEAGAKPQHGPAILRNVGLVKGEHQGGAWLCYGAFLLQWENVPTGRRTEPDV